MNKKLIIFTHHFKDDFVKWNFENIKKLNTDWDIISVGFSKNSTLLENSIIVNKEKYPINNKLIEHFYVPTVEWSEPDLFLYESYFQYPNYESYFMYEYDTVCNVPIENFFDTSVDFFGNNIFNPAPETWWWAELYRKFNTNNVLFPTLFAYGQSTCVYFKNNILKQCSEEIVKNKDLYCQMLSELRGGTIVSKFTKLIQSKENIKDYIWWEKSVLKFGMKEYFYHPIKSFLEIEKYIMI
jgi:hypothetical protein